MKKNKRLSKVWSKRHLPEDLWPGILSMLPVKSLLRFRCVSKAWLSLIKDPDFCRLHLKNFKNNSDETHLLVVEGKQRNCVVRCSDTFQTNAVKLFSLIIGRMLPEERWEVVCSIDGLVLLKNNLAVLGFNELMVWNPSIRKFHDIPFLPKIEASQDSFIYTDIGLSFIYTDIGLGYDPMIKDYKQVQLIFRHEVLHSVAIYTLGACTWKIIQPKGSGFSFSEWQWQWDPEYYMNLSVYLQGSMYFIAQVPARGVSELISFDLSNEAFRSTSLPENTFISSIEYYGSLTLVDGGRSLGACDYDVDLSIWVLETESMCWTKRYSFTLYFPEFRYIKKNGDMLIWWGKEETSLRLLTSKELVQKWYVMLSYNLETKTEKIILQTKHSGFKIHHVCGYIESLILLK